MAISKVNQAIPNVPLMGTELRPSASDHSQQAAQPLAVPCRGLPSSTFLSRIPMPLQAFP